jgi:FixJ family two-component response regulator
MEERSIRSEYGDVTTTTAHEKSQSLISIVDDDASVRESLSSLVRSVGYMAKLYTSAEDFLSRAQGEESACLILDVSMPGMDGLELQSRLKGIGSRTPIVFLSAKAKEDDERRALREGATAFFRKPVNDEVLLNAIRAAIKGQSR